MSSSDSARNTVRNTGHMNTLLSHWVNLILDMRILDDGQALEAWIQGVWISYCLNSHSSIIDNILAPRIGGVSGQCNGRHIVIIRKVSFTLFTLFFRCLCSISSKVAATSPILAITSTRSEMYRKGHIENSAREQHDHMLSHAAGSFIIEFVHSPVTSYSYVYSVTKWVWRYILSSS